MEKTTKDQVCKAQEKHLSVDVYKQFVSTIYLYRVNCICMQIRRMHGCILCILCGFLQFLKTQKLNFM